MTFTDSLHTDKCKVMHIGRQPRMVYYIEGHKLEKCQEQKDLGILVSGGLKVGLSVTRNFLKLTGC